MIVDAIILTGGRSSRLDTVPKAGLMVDGRSLLGRTIDAASSARRIVVVGPPPDLRLPKGTLRVQEDPPFAGPVAGIASGLSALNAAASASGSEQSEAVLVLACDMPHLDRAMPRLLKGLIDNPEMDGVIAVDADQHLQPLAAGYRTSSLARALAIAGATAPLAGMAVFRLLDTLMWTPVDVPADSTADVDTWEDARRLGVTAVPPREASSTRNTG